MLLLDRIRKDYAGMSAVEKRIADVILNAPEQVINMTVAHLSASARVSEGSVINFAGRLGVRGFSAMKLRLARESETFADLSFGCVSAQDSPLSALQKVARSAADAFRQTSRTIDGGALQTAAERLMSARRIDIYGAGDSALMAQDAYFHMMRIGLPAYAVTDYLALRIAASQLDGDCAALALSHSGQTMGIVDAMEIARERKAWTICVTSYEDSALSRLCDTVLVTCSRETKFHEEAAVSRLAHLMVLDSLCAYISARRAPEAVERMDQVNAQLSRYRYPTDMTERRKNR